MSQELLRMSLQVAVPLHAREMMRCPIDELVALGPDLAQVIAEKGDVIQFAGKKRGETAAAFNALAKALAIMSFWPGGVLFLGDRYEHRHPGFDEMQDQFGAEMDEAREFFDTFVRDRGLLLFEVGDEVEDAHLRLLERCERPVTHPVQATRAELAEGFLVHGNAVPLVALEPVPRKLHGKPDHLAVPRDLREDASGTDGGHGCISLGDALDPSLKLEVAVCDAADAFEPPRKLLVQRLVCLTEASVNPLLVDGRGGDQQNARLDGGVAFEGDEDGFALRL